MRLSSRESLLEGGFVLLAFGCAAGLGALIIGRLAGDAARHRSHHEPAPEPGSVPGERHQLLHSSPR